MKRLSKIILLSLCLAIVSPYICLSAIGQRYAVLIGIPDHPDLPKIESAEKDVDYLRQQLIKCAYFRPENIITLKSKDATFARFQGVIDEFTKLTPDDLLFVYFSGHGTALKEEERGEGKRYYFFYDVMWGRQRTYIGEDKFKQELADIKARKVLVLDTCYSGKGKSVSPVPGGKAAVLPDSFTPGPIDAIISACASDEIAYDGVFTPCLGEAFKKADKNRDDKIMLSEIYAYLADEVPRKNAKQHPQISPSDYNDFTFVENLGIIEINSIPAGAKLYLNDEYKGETPIKVECPPGIYKVKLEIGKKVTEFPPLTINFGFNPDQTYTISTQIIGKVVYKQNKQPVVSAEITPIGEGVFSGVSNESGRFEIDVKPGKYRGLVIMGATVEQIVVERFFTLDVGEKYDIGEIEVPAKCAILEIVTNVPWSDVKVNGVSKGNTGIHGRLLIKLEPGEYKITVEKNKYYSEQRKIQLDIAQKRKLELELIPKSPPTRFSIGLGNPYLSLKFGQKWDIEARGAFGSGIKVFSGRILRNFGKQDQKEKQGFSPGDINIFTGLELGAISFDNSISGKGFLGYGFVGLEYFITKKLAFSMDIGAAHISLTEKKTEIDVSTIEFVANMGINFYFR